MIDSERNVFKDDVLFHQFERQGYVIIPLFASDELAELMSVFQRYFPDIPEAFFSSSFLSNYDLKKKISGEIEHIITPKLEEHFKDFRCLGAAFLSKAPDKNSELPMHQDWTIVDESKYVATNIWTPLTQLTSENGTLQVLPGSHKTFRSVRAPTIPFSANDLRDEIKKHLVPLYVKPGEVVVLDQALVHYSGPNQSNESRIAFTTGLISKNAPLHFHYWDKQSSELEKFAMDDDFLFRWEQFHVEIFQRPRFGNSLGKELFKPEVFGQDRLEQTVNNEMVIPADEQGSTRTGIRSFFHKLFSA